MGYKVAVIGATGNVGREMLNILAEREFPADEVFAIASRKSMGVEVSYGDERLKCRDLENFDFRGIDFALRDGPGAIVLLAPERTAGMNEQNLEPASAFPVGQNARAQHRSLGSLCQRCHIAPIFAAQIEG
jgi:aspartate-semialdehyde dehydrogenase